MRALKSTNKLEATSEHMNHYWTNARHDQAQTLCLRGAARVPVVAGMESLSVAVMPKDFIAHDPGGSDG